MIFWSAVLERRGYFLLSAAIVVVDQATKLLAFFYLRDRGTVEVIPNLFNLWYSTNPGGLFGYFRNWGDPWRTLLLTLLPLVAILFIVAFLAHGDRTDRWTFSGLSLILGGAIGNLLDRVIHGEVIDFLDVYAAHEGLASRLIAWFGTAHWPTFNVADSAIVVGACMLLVTVGRSPESTPADASASGSAAQRGKRV